MKHYCSFLGRHLVDHRLRAASQSQRPSLNLARPATSAMLFRRQQSNISASVQCFSRQQFNLFKAKTNFKLIRLGLSLTSTREASPPCLVFLMRREAIQRQCSQQSLRSVHQLLASSFIQRTTEMSMQNIFYP